MQIKRSKLRAGYVQIPNTIARHGRLSLEARGLVLYLLSLPDGAGATVDKIASKVSNGRRSVSMAMNELIEAGYVKRAKLQDPETGRWITITTVTDTPESSDAPTDRLPTVGEATGRAVGASPIGSKTKSTKDITPPPAPPQEAAPPAPERPGPKTGGEGEAVLVDKLNRGLTREAHRVLVRLSLHKALPLTDREISRLVPKVVPWLREDYRSEEILRCLTSDLPEQIGSVPGLVSHRLTHFTPERAAFQQPTPQPVERAKCDVCQTIYPLGHEGGTCRQCTAEMTRAAAFVGAGL
jgi:hypothetical protein